jgi:hypothetical protein
MNDRHARAEATEPKLYTKDQVPVDSTISPAESADGEKETYTHTERVATIEKSPGYAGDPENGQDNDQELPVSSPKNKDKTKQK